MSKNEITYFFESLCLVELQQLAVAQGLEAVVRQLHARLLLAADGVEE